MKKVWFILITILITNLYILYTVHEVSTEIPTRVIVDKHTIDSIKIENRIIDSTIFNVQKRYINDTAYIRVADQDALYKLFSDYIESYQRAIADSESNICRTQETLSDSSFAE